MGAAEASVEQGASAAAALELEMEKGATGGSSVYAPSEREKSTGAEPPDGSWLRGMYLLVTSTAGPPLLGLPFGIAALGWAGGMSVLLVSGAVIVYCNLLLASLFEWGGKRHTTFRDMSHNIMGSVHRYAYYYTMVPQFVVIIGVGWASLILAGQCLQAVYDLYCGDSCGVKNFAWKGVAGALLAVVAQLPSMSSAELITTMTTTFLIIYSVSTCVLAGIQGGGKDADYSIPGNTINRLMNAWNALGIVVFMYANNIVPEVQATLRPDPATGSVVPAMRRSIFATYSLVATLYLVVSVVGYWAYGNAVSGFLLGMMDHPKWLITVLNLMCVIQLIVGEQVFEWVLYDSWEPHIIRYFSNTRWLRTERHGADGTMRMRPSRWLMLLVRGPYIFCITFLAAAFPFFSSIMGLVGSAGLTPTCFIMPIALYLIAHGRAKLGAVSWWAHITVALLFTIAGTLAAIGAVRSIVLSIQDHTFFS